MNLRQNNRNYDNDYRQGPKLGHTLFFSGFKSFGCNSLGYGNTDYKYGEYQSCTNRQFEDGRYRRGKTEDKN